MTITITYSCVFGYSHLSNSRGGWNNRGGGAKVAKSINVEAGINMEGGIFWKKLVYKCNKRDSTFIREMRVRLACPMSILKVTILDFKLLQKEE